jgi:hypothetical protein
MSLFDKLNLRPGERRLVVVVGVVLFVVIQVIFVWPHFGDMEKMNLRRAKAIDELRARTDTIAATNKFAAELKAMESDGLDVPPEDQAVELARSIQAQSSQSHVLITTTSKSTTRTNDAFFVEQSQTITTISDEGSLINFLYNLGAGNSLTRVRDLTMRPDPSRTKITATIKLVASYQKKPAVRAAAKAPAPARSEPPRAPVSTPKPAAPTSPNLPRK